MEYTQYYSIAKHGPQGEGEALSAYSIVNVAMDKIDSLLHDIWNRIAVVEDKISVLEDRLEEIDARVTDVENRVTSVENRVTSVENRVTNLESNLDEVVQDISTINSQITEINSDLAAVWDAIANIVSKVVGGGSVNETNGTITWNASGTIPLGNINVYSNDGSIRTTTATASTPGTNDIEVN